MLFNNNDNNDNLTLIKIVTVDNNVFIVNNYYLTLMKIFAYKYING